MRTNTHNASAFTLIELLVVIAIIAILIGLLFPAFIAVQNQAKKIQAKNDLTQIVTAVNAYYTEYGRYPVDVNTNTSPQTDAYFGSGTVPPLAVSYGSNDWLLDVLRNNTSSTKTATYTCTGAINLVTCLNPRGIVFISPPYVKNPLIPRSGIGAPTGTGPGEFFDPWGTPYNIAIDTNYNNIVTAPPYSDLTYSTATGTPKDVGPLTGVIAWSYGTDQTQETSFTTADDVISWQ